MSPAVEAVQRLAKVMGVPYGHYAYHDSEPDTSALDPDHHGGESPTAYKRQTSDGRWITTQPSALEADHNSAYGGWVIDQIAPNGRTWISKPFGDTRRPLRSFLNFVEAQIARIESEREVAR